MACRAAELHDHEGAGDCDAHGERNVQGSAVEAGSALSLNHLYLATETGGVTAQAEATVLVSGTWSVE